MRQAKAVKVSQETGGLQITKPQSVFLSNEILDLRCKTTLKGYIILVPYLLSMREQGQCTSLQSLFVNGQVRLC